MARPRGRKNVRYLFLCHGAPHVTIFRRPGVSGISLFIRFLKKINRAVAKHLDVHAICDNYKTHKTKEVQVWLAKHPRFKLHFTPTSSSWINLVERLFAEITRQQIRRGVFKSVAELEAAIETWLTERNAKPKPFKWTANANIILEKNARARRALEEDLAGTK